MSSSENTLGIATIDLFYLFQSVPYTCIINWISYVMFAIYSEFIFSQFRVCLQIFKKKKKKLLKHLWVLFLNDNVLVMIKYYQFCHNFYIILIYCSSCLQWVGFVCIFCLYMYFWASVALSFYFLCFNKRFWTQHYCVMYLKLCPNESLISFQNDIKRK